MSFSWHFRIFTGFKIFTGKQICQSNFFHGALSRELANAVKFHRIFMGFSRDLPPVVVAGVWHHHRRWLARGGYQALVICKI